MGPLAEMTGSKEESNTSTFTAFEVEDELQPEVEFVIVT
jgi:hypothetical protein